MTKPLTPHLERLEQTARTHSHTLEALTYCFATDGYVECLRLLPAHGRFRITCDQGWRVCGFWPEHDPLSSPAPAPSLGQRPWAAATVEYYPPVCPALRN